MSHDSSVLYKRVYEVLQAGILNGTYPPGSRLPTEPELMMQFNVSRVTLRLSLALLKQEGLIISLPAKGTFVAKVNAQWKELTARLIVVITPDVDSGFYSKIIRGIEREAYTNGFYVLVHASNDLVAEEERCLKELCAEVAGFVITAAAVGERTAGGFAPVISQGVPFVFVDRYVEEPCVDRVTSDNERGGYLATRHLLDLGHRRIGVILPREYSSFCLRFRSSFAGRIAGYAKALAEAGIAYEEALIARPERPVQDYANVEYFREGGLLTQKLLALPRPPTALFVVNNMAAFGALRQLQSCEIAVPDEMALVGYDGVDTEGYITPAITTVDQEPLQMGTIAARLLLARIRKEVLPPQCFELPVTLRVRASSAPALKEERP
jgi:DNA-binding LacI/PurR family transcriptional regulator